MVMEEHEEAPQPYLRGFELNATCFEETRGLSGSTLQQWAETLAPHLQVWGGLVLEVGAGTGRFTRPLTRCGVQLVPLDRSRGMILEGRRRGTSGYVRGDAGRLPFRDGAFSQAMLVHFLHLVPDPLAVVREVRRVTQRGLVAISFEPQGEAPWSRYLELLANDQGRHTPFPGLPERDLASVVPPDEEIELLTVHDHRHADQMLRWMEDHSYSFTWAVPARVHRRLMDQLRAEGFDRQPLPPSKVRFHRWSAQTLMRV